MSLVKSLLVPCPACGGWGFTERTAKLPLRPRAVTTPLIVTVSCPMCEGTGETLDLQQLRPTTKEARNHTQPR